jgi:hypothetical protein
MEQSAREIQRKVRYRKGRERYRGDDEE